MDVRGRLGKGIVVRHEPFIRTGVALVTIGCVAGIAITVLYGNNGVAETVQEAIAELTIVLVTLTGVVLHTIGRALK